MNYGKLQMFSILINDAIVNDATNDMTEIKETPKVL
jgi:hypothetical protein